MKGLTERFAEIERKARQRKNVHRRQRLIRKSRTKLIRFNRPDDRCFVLSTGHAKCQDCGTLYGMHVLGCTPCYLRLDQPKGVRYGAVLNVGQITRDRFKPVVQDGVFVSYQHIYERLKAGDRFMDCMGRILKARDFERRE